jgi:hypothetical protein
MRSQKFDEKITHLIFFLCLFKVIWEENEDCLRTMVAQLGLWAIDGMYLQQYFRYRYIGNIAVSFQLVEKTGVPGDI